ncbi:PaaI family thioesterase [Roseivirga sp.]|uniref:PaaI family thioesterase n=1 Tax=Roseivirga sp. TaxID=1964215 RepID=UPI003B8B39DA
MSLDHFQRLENLFHSAPIQDMLSGAQMKVGKGKSVYTLNIKPAYFHAAEAMHGAIYFKLLDDAAYFAAASLELDFFLLTKSYTIQFIRPVQVDALTAKGKIVKVDGQSFVAKSEIVNSKGKVVAHGEGVFVRSKKPLLEQAGYVKL